MNINIISSINDIKDDYYYYKEKINIHIIENNIYNNQFNEEKDDIDIEKNNTEIKKEKKSKKDISKSAEKSKKSKNKSKEKDENKKIDNSKDEKNQQKYIVNKKNLLDKRFIEIYNKTDIRYYEFYINDSKPIISTNIIKNHMSYSIVKYTSFNILFRPFTKPTIETLNIFIFFENMVEYYFKNKIINQHFRDYKDFKFINNIHKNPEYSLALKVKINDTKIDIPIFNTSNNIIDFTDVKKDDSLKYLIELDSIYLDCSKKIYGINWKILQVLKEDDLFKQKCFLLNNTNKNINNNLNSYNNNYNNYNNLNNYNTSIINQNNIPNIIPPPIPPNKQKIPNPPLFFPISSIRIDDLQKMKHKITGKKLET